MAMLYKKPEISKEPISPPPSLAEFIKTEKEYVAKLEAIFKNVFATHGTIQIFTTYDNSRGCI